MQTWPSLLRFRRKPRVKLRRQRSDGNRRAAGRFGSLRSKVSGFVGGLHNKIRVPQRRAYGLHDEEYLRLKVLTCMPSKL